ncbi:MAG: hypothetical protein EOS86_26460 [Mesorhizobium sp.]|nr:MAG: hypothetical protein EOS86_26460 [Mesorhizobium sp.]
MSEAMHPLAPPRDRDRQVGGLDRRQVRRRFEECFSASRMADDYEAIYASVAAGMCEPKTPRGS